MEQTPQPSPFPRFQNRHDPAPRIASSNTPVTASDAHEPPVEMDRFRELSGRDENGVRDLAQLYLTQTSAHLEKLKEAVRTADAMLIGRIAHTCAGSSATCGMTRIVPLLRELERQGHEKELARAPEVLAQAIAEFATIQQFFTRQPQLQLTLTP